MTAIWRTLTRNLGWKLLSVVLAVFLWIAVEGEPELVTVQSVPVFYRNVEPTLALVASPPAAVRLEMRGATGVLTRENLASVTLLVDLAGVTEPGEKLFPVSRAKVTLPAGVTFVRADPPELRLHLDRPAPVDRASESKGNPAPKQ